MNKKSELKISKGSIVFYIAAIIFLGIGAFYFFVTYQSVSLYSQQLAASQQGKLELLDVLNAYFSNCGPFFAYAFGCYGIGFILSKLNHLIQILTDCMNDEVAVKTVVESSEVEEDKEAE